MRWFSPAFADINAVTFDSEQTTLISNNCKEEK